MHYLHMPVMEMAEHPMSWMEEEEEEVQVKREVVMVGRAEGEGKRESVDQQLTQVPLLLLLTHAGGNLPQAVLPLLLF